MNSDLATATRRKQTITLDYPEEQLILEHRFNPPSESRLDSFYRAAPSIWVCTGTEKKLLGQSNTVVAGLHSLICVSGRKFQMNGESKGELIAELNREDILKLCTRKKVEGVIYYLAFYAPTVKHINELPDGKEIVVNVTTHPGYEQTGESFDLYFVLPSGQDLGVLPGEQITVGVDDPLAQELLHQEGYSVCKHETLIKAIPNISGHGRIFDRWFDHADKLINGVSYDPTKKSRFLASLDPMLKIHVVYKMSTLSTLACT